MIENNTGEYVTEKVRTMTEEQSEKKLMPLTGRVETSINASSTTLNSYEASILQRSNKRYRRWGVHRLL